MSSPLSRAFILAGVLGAGLSFGQQAPPPAAPATAPAAPATAPAKLPEAVLADAHQRLAKAAAWLLATQNDDGSWGQHKHPAMAALAAMALNGAAVPAADVAKRDAAVTKALAYILQFAQKDGSICRPGGNPQESGDYPNYTTSIALLGLAAINRPQDQEVMRRARAYLMSSQFNDPASVDYGGVGYGKTGRADLSNASWAVEALYFTDHLDREPLSKDPADAKRSTEMWQKMGTFLTQCQNLPETNKNPSVSKAPEDRGGFFYRPNESKAGSRDGEGKDTNLVSSGSMTYAGLKSMLYARLDRGDVRVKGAIDYLKRTYTLAENPGMGQQGYYYYLHIMTKALEAYGVEQLEDAKGAKHAWREEVLASLAQRQREDGSWKNDNGRYMEMLPELVTPYCVIVQRIALGEFSLKYQAAP